MIVRLRTKRYGRYPQNAAVILALPNNLLRRIRIARRIQDTRCKPPFSHGMDTTKQHMGRLDSASSFACPKAQCRSQTRIESMDMKNVDIAFTTDIALTNKLSPLSVARSGLSVNILAGDER